MSMLPFILAASLLAVTPGPGLAYVVARTAAGGRSEGLASCFGTALGGFVHVAGATLGLSVLLAQSAFAFALVKYLGAAYLIYMGIQMLRHSNAIPAPSLQTVAQDTRRAVFAGITVEALNVKTALFFLAFLPQFTSADAPLAPQLAGLGSICVALNTLVDVGAVFGTNWLLASSVGRAARGRFIKRVSGCTMMTIGVLLGLSRR